MGRRKIKAVTQMSLNVWIYLFLFGAVATYYFPVVSIHFPALGKKSWSLYQIVRFLPKPVFSSKKDAGLDLDFRDALEKIFPQMKQEDWYKKIPLELIFVVLMPVALFLAYLMVFLGFFFTPLKQGLLMHWTSALALLASVYALLAVYVLAHVAHEQFAVAGGVNAGKNPFSILARAFAKEIRVQPESALFALVALTGILFILVCWRPAR